MKESKSKVVKPKKVKINYAEEIQIVPLEEETTKNPRTTSLSKVSQKMREEINSKASFAINKNLSIKELQEKENALANSVLDYMEKHGITYQAQEIEQEPANPEQQQEDTKKEQNRQTLKNQIQDLLNEITEDSLKEYENAGNQENNKDSKSNLTCTQAEREFLDNFYKVQEAGALLGMATTGSKITDSTIINLEIHPRINKINESDKLKVDEQNEVVEVYSLLTLKTLEIVKSVNKMLQEKNIITKA